MKRSQQKSERASEKICKKLGITPEILPRGSLIEIRGDRSMTVKGCRKILLYKESKILLDLYGRSLEICGQKLVCTTYYPGAVVIDGKITSINFSKVGN